MIHGDICIIGGGAAGITMAHRLMRLTMRRIILIETGSDAPRRKTEALNAVEISNERYAAFSMFRRRALGGSTTVWGGRCVPYDPIDFAERGHVPYSGWPLTRAELDRYYEIALGYCEAGNAEFDCEKLAGELGPLIADFNSEVVRTDSAELYSPPTNFGRVFRAMLHRAQNVGVLVNLTCIGLSLDANTGRITAANCRTLNHKTLRVEAGRFVVATGGIENYRLLAVSNDVQRDGLGNSGGQLGRYFMTHIEGNLGTLQFETPEQSVRWEFHRTQSGAYARRRLSIFPETQSAQKIMNFVARLHHPPVADPRHKNAILSAMFLSKSFLIPEYREKFSMHDRLASDGLAGSTAFWGGHLRNISTGLPNLAAFAARWIRLRHMSYRRIPYVALSGREGGYTLEFNAEQAPHPDNRLTLSPRLDHINMQKVKIDWGIKPADINSIIVNYRLLRDAFTQSGLATLSGDEDSLAENTANFAPVGGHFIGATRMSETPQTGVVDKNCRLHDVPNIYVAGSSVFPTSSHANPTFTIVAMAARLADHLDQSQP